MDDLLFNIIKLLVIIVVSVFVRYGVPLVKQIVERYQMEEVLKWVEVAVNAAEQTIKAGGSGKDKKAIVTKFLKEILMEKDLALSEKQLDNLIEAAVFAMNGGKEE